MNKIHKLVWNARSQSYMAASEAASSRGHAPSEKRAIAAVAASLAGLLASGSAWAIPVCAGPQSTTVSANTGSTVTASCNQETITINQGVTIDVPGDTALTNNDGGLYWNRTTVVNNGTIMGMTPVVLTGDVGAMELDSFTNNGTIESYNTLSGNFGGHAVTLDNLTITGTISNTGTITAGYDGVHFGGGTTAPLLVNSGTIFGSVSGVNVNGSQLDEIRNEAIGIIQGNNLGAIAVESGGTIGLIDNQGTITSPSSGIAARQSGSVITKIVNAQGATIEGSEGISITDDGHVVDIENRGTINGSSAGVELYNGKITGTLTNYATGIISGGSAGIAMGTYDQPSDIHAIINEGLITGTYGIDGQEGSVISSGINNSGTIKGTDTGILLRDSSSIAGGIVNSGTIEGARYAIRVAGGSSIDRLDITGLAAQLKGDVDASTTEVNVKAGAKFSTTNAFNVQSFNVESGGELTLTNAAHTQNGLSTDGITVSNGFINNGSVLISSATLGRINGTYTQSAGSTLQVGIDSVANHGVLSVSGDATLSSGSTLKVAVGNAATFNGGDRVQGVVTSGGTLAATGLTVSDNSVLYKFTADTSRVASELDLLVSPDEAPFVNNVGAGRTPLVGVAQTLDKILADGVPAELQPVMDRLTSLTTEQAQEAMQQLLPVMTGAGSQAGVNALRSMNKIIQSRVESNQGLSSGNPAAERYLWVRAFGSSGEQDSQDVVAGFRSQTGGIVIGGDKPINDKLRAGFAFTYARTDIDSRGSGAPSSLDVNTYELVHYGSYNLDPVTDINYQVDAGYNTVKGVRQILFMGQQAHSDFNSLNLHASVGIGRTWALSSQSSMTPSVRLDYTHMKTGDYTETGAGSLNLQVDDSTFKEFMLTADIKGSHNLTERTKLVGNVSAGYDFTNKQSVTTSSFVGGGAVFETKGLDSSPWLYRGGLGLLHDSNGMEYSLRYDLERRTSGYTNQTLSARVRWAF